MIQVWVINVEMTANKADAYLVGGQLKKRKRKGKGHLYQIQGQIPTS